MQRKRLRPDRFFPLVAAALVGCSGPPGPVAGQPAARTGQEVVVLCGNDDSAAFVKSLARSWEGREGARVVVRTDPETDVRVRLAHQGGANAPGLMLIRAEEMPRLAADDKLEQLPPELMRLDNAYGWDDLLPVYREQVLVWDRKVFALPLIGESPLCCYRDDLFKEDAHREAYQKKYGRPLAAPATWEDFADQAEYFAAALKKPSLPPAPASDAALDREYFSIAAPYARRAVLEEEKENPERTDQLFSFHYDHRTGAARIAQPGFAHALDVMRRLQACRPTGTAADPVEAFQRGEAVLCLANVHDLFGFQAAKELRDKVGVCTMPGSSCYFDYQTGERRPTTEPNRVSYLRGGGWLGVVPKGAPDVAAAFGLLADLSGRERSVQILVDPRWGGGPTRRDHLEHGAWEAFDLDQPRTQALRDAMRQTLLHPLTKNPVVCLRTPDQAAHRTALLTAVRSYLKDPKADATATLREVAAEWAKLDKNEKHLGDYRISLGLLAQP